MDFVSKIPGIKSVIIITITHLLQTRPYHRHEHNFVVKCEGDSLVSNQYITKPRENCGETWHIISPLYEKVGGRIPRAPT